MGTRLLLTLSVVLALFAQGCSTTPQRGGTGGAHQPGGDSRHPRGALRLTEIDLMAREGLESWSASAATSPRSATGAAAAGGVSGGLGRRGCRRLWRRSAERLDQGRQRPQFKLVTGISTGALIAPFAFLGPKYDERLKDFYTNIGPADIVEHRSLWAAITNDALADNRPLWNRVAKEVDRALLDEIAAEYDKGRLLLIATSDLDARQAVIWNMTKIASSKDARALDLFAR